MDSFFDTIRDITVYSSAIYPILYLISLKGKSRAYKVFTLYLFLIAIIQLYSEYLVVAKNVSSNLFLSHYYFILQFLLLSSFYALLLKNRYIKYITIVGLAAILIQYYIDPGLYHMFNPIGMMLTHLVIVVYGIWFLYKSLTTAKEFTIVSSGLFVYFLSSALIFASGNLIFDLKVPEYVSRFLNRTNFILYLIFQILIFVEWWRNYRPRKL